MASINTIVKRKQYLWLGIVVVGTASAIGGALYLSDVDMSGNGETVAEQEPVPDMTGVVDTTFDDKVRQHATTEMQVTAAQMQKQYPHVQPDRQYHALLPVYFFLDTRWSGFMGKNKLADVCERLYLLVVYHAGRHAGFNQVPAGI